MKDKMLIPALHLAGYDVALRYFKKPNNEEMVGLVFVVKDENGNEIEASDIVESWSDNEENAAKVNRLKLLMESICHYRNSGGPDLDDLWSPEVQMHGLIMSMQSLPSPVWPEGWKLWLTSEDGYCLSGKHNGEQVFLRVVRNEFTELLNAEEMISLYADKEYVKVS
jgi:hypothetical protein